MPDLMTTFKFSLEVGGIQLGTFRKASGVASETEVIEFKEMTKEGKMIIRKVPGPMKWDDITLERRMDSTRDLWEWRKKVEEATSTAPAATARCGLVPTAAQSRSGHTRRASRTSPLPWARDALRAAGAGVRASVSRSAAVKPSAPSCTAAAMDAVTRPLVRMRRRRKARSVTTSTTSPLVIASSTPPE